MKNELVLNEKQIAELIAKFVGAMQLIEVKENEGITVSFREDMDGSIVATVKATTEEQFYAMVEAEEATQQ